MPTTPAYHHLFNWVLLLFLLFTLFAHLDDHQLEFYDEARTAVNAIEMAEGNHHPLILHYNGEPDHWNAKPPLFVWLQAVCIKVLGIGELAVRLPSALATVALVFLLCWWSRKRFGDISVGVVAGATIFSFKAYTITHGMRSADFDALLIFFLVAQAFCFYQWVVTDRRKYLWLAALAVFLGMMTKGVAGGFYLPGIGIWFLLTRAGRKKLLDPGLYLSVGGAIGIMVGYYFLREHLDPGYFAQVTKNELSGRYVEHERQYTFFFHLERLYNGRYFRHLFLAAVVAIPVGLFGPHRRETLFVSVVGAAFLVVISGSAVKHYWYSFPILPMLGLLAGLLVWRVYTYVKEKTTTRLGAVAYALLVVGLFTQPAYHLTQRVLAPREHQVSKPKHIPYRPAMRAFGGVRNYTVLAEDYNPTARFYVALERERGKNVQLRCWAPKVPPDASKPLLELTAAPGDTVLACHQVTRDYLRDNYSFTTYGKAGDCSMVVITGE